MTENESNSIELIAPLRDNSERARTAIIFFYVLLAVSVITSAYVFYVTINQTDLYYDYGELQQNSVGLIVAGLASSAVSIGVIIVFIMWFRRAYWNLHQIVGVDCRYTEGWAAGCWFVPIINLFWPYQIMRDMYVDYQKLANPGSLPRGAQLVGVWWALWILAYFIEFLDVIDPMLQLGTILSTLASLVNIFLIIAIIRRISAWETDVRLGNTEMDITDHLIAD